MESKPCISHDKLPSTNGYAIKLLKYNKPSEGTVITTFDQCKGKGQLNSTWISNPGQNLTCSIILYPIFLPLDKIYYLNKAIGVAVVKSIESVLNKTLTIKWPNDILYQQKKLVGILVQNSLMGKEIMHSVVGIGINVNQIKFSDNLKAISLKQIQQEKFSINRILNNLRDQIDKLYELLKQECYPSIDDQYHARLLGINQDIEYRETGSNKSFFGRTLGVDDNGKIKLLIKGEIRKYAFKEIEVIK